MKDKDNKKPIISAAIGGTFFALPYLLLNIPVLPSIGIAAVAFGAGNLLLSDKNEDDEFDKELDFEGKVRKAKNQINDLYVIMNKLEDKELVDDVAEIRSTSLKIVEAAEKNPAKADKLDTFFRYYLPVTIKILNQYDEIEDNRLDSEESNNMMEHTKSTIKKIKSAFKKTLTSLYESEIIDTEAEMKVFEKMLDSEGFGDIKIKK